MKQMLIFILMCASVYAQVIPNTEIKKENPFNGIQYDFIKIGKTQKYSRFRTKYYWRYITVYNEIRTEQVIKDVPRFEENCHDQGNRVASWEFTKTFSREISTGASFSLLGFIEFDLGGSLSHEFSISITRWIQAVNGIWALHTPVLKSKEMRGMTYIQRYYPNEDRFEDIAIPRDDFIVTNIDPIFSAEREIIGSCD